jgi:hypothetical protein
MKGQQKRDSSSEPTVLQMKEEGTLTCANGAAPYVQDAQTQITEAEQQVREIVQQSTAALAEIVRNMPAITKGKDFRMHVQEEINIIDRC